MKHPIIAIGCCVAASLLAPTSAEPPSTEYFRDAIHHWQMEHPAGSYPRWDENDYTRIADNLLAYQNEDGGWMKNIDWLSKENPDSVKATLNRRHRQSTLDNRNVVPQVEYLADVYTRTGDEKYRRGAERGIAYILDTQKDNGGWRGWDADAITFNDDVTTNALFFLCDVIQGDTLFKWLDRETVNRMATALHKGIDMILRCQVVQNGVKTVWAQQHDNVTLLPTSARSYELPGLSAPESSRILQLLMHIDNPDARVKEAVRCGVKWLWNNRIEGIRLKKFVVETDSTGKAVYDRIVVNDPEARPMWARYYDLESNRPFFCTRTGKKVWSMAEVERERRTGYGWYGYQPLKVLKEYPDWAKRMGIPFDGYDKM